MREEVNQKGKDLTQASDDIFYMKNSSVSRSDDTFKYDNCDKSYYGIKDCTPGSNDIYKHGNDSEYSESVSIGTNYEGPGVKCKDILNDIDNKFCCYKVGKDF